MFSNENNISMIGENSLVLQTCIKENIQIRNG